MKIKTPLLLILSTLVLITMACAFLTLGSAEPSPEPTLTILVPSATVTVVPPTSTPNPPSPTPTLTVPSIDSGNLQRLNTIWEFTVPGDSFRSAAFSPDNQSLAAGTGMNQTSQDQKLRLWDVKTGILQAESEKLYAIIWDLRYTPNGNLIAVALDNATVEMRNAADLSLVYRIEYQGAVNSLSISPDGTKLAAGVASGEGGVVSIRNIVSGEMLVEFWAHPYSVPGMDFSPDGTLLATGAIDRSVKIWNSQTGELLQTLPQAAQGTAVKFSPDGSLLASGHCGGSINTICQKGTITLWNTDNWQIFKTLDGAQDWVDGVAFSTDRSVLAGLSRDGFIYFWRISDGILLQKIQVSYFKPEVLSISNDGRYLATGAGENLKTWRVNP
ncbi:MAG: WD40 repeat domain-containing protein [Anaerolineales bacterium]|nr:WD40 repeat domain-containing protein [Anaerolineales bacterium]